MRLYGLIGFPLSHSFSKKYFSEKFEQERLSQCRYELFPIEHISALTELLHSNPALAGLNITVPYKKLVLPFLHNTTGIPKGLDACNCIRIEQGKLYGFNTDWIGFEKSLQPLLHSYHQHALVLGTGGASEAVLFVLKRMGITCTSVSRTPASRDVLNYTDITTEIISEHKLIINTTPLGMYPATDQCPDLPYGAIGEKHLLYDLIYNPAITTFLKIGAEQGASVKNGEEMLVIQAEESWKIWNSSFAATN